MVASNAELVRAGYESFNRTRQLDLEAFHPDVEWHTRQDLPDSDIHRGHEGVARLFSEWVSSFEDLRGDPEEVIDAGEHVVAVVRLRGRVRGSGQEVEMLEAHVWSAREGKVTMVREYGTKAEALQAIGLKAE